MFIHIYIDSFTFRFAKNHGKVGIWSFPFWGLAYFPAPMLVLGSVQLQLFWQVFFSRKYGDPNFGWLKPFFWIAHLGLGCPRRNSLRAVFAIQKDGLCNRNPGKDLRIVRNGMLKIGWRVPTPKFQLYLHFTRGVVYDTSKSNLYHYVVEHLQFLLYLEKYLEIIQRIFCGGNPPYSSMALHALAPLFSWKRLAQRCDSTNITHLRTFFLVESHGT